LHHAYPTRHLESREQGLAAFGKHAKHAASDLAFWKKVTLQTFGKDKYGRTIADVIMPDGLNLNQELVKQDWWWYRKYAPGIRCWSG
jgi:endonuclease YncB( thermonuclease family)